MATQNYLPSTVSFPHHVYTMGEKVHLRLLEYDFDVWGTRSVEKLLEVVFQHARQLSMDHGLQLHTCGLTKSLLGFDRCSAFPQASLGVWTSEISFGVFFTC